MYKTCVVLLLGVERLNRDGEEQRIFCTILINHEKV